MLINKEWREKIVVERGGRFGGQVKQKEKFCKSKIECSAMLEFLVLEFSKYQKTSFTFIYAYHLKKHNGRYDLS